MIVNFTVNEHRVAVEAPQDGKLIDILRDNLGLIGAKNACSIGQCGACLVLLDDRPVNACLVIAAQLNERHVVTFEGLGPPGKVVETILVRSNAAQCGYCIPGLVTALTWLRSHAPQLTSDEVEIMLSNQI